MQGRRHRRLVRQSEPGRSSGEVHKGRMKVFMHGYRKPGLWLIGTAKEALGFGELSRNNSTLFFWNCMYRVEATTIEGFIQQLAVRLVAKGYRYYVTGDVSGSKDPKATDLKIIRQYGLDISKFTRYRRKQLGIPAVQYLRYRNFFVLIATDDEGEHPFLQTEKDIKDIREIPIKFMGYSVSFRGGHACVRIERERFKELESYFIELAPKTSARHLEFELRRLDFEPFGPIRSQLLKMLRRINGIRKAAGLELLVSRRCFRFKPKSVKPFEPVRGRDAAIAA